MAGAAVAAGETGGGDQGDVGAAVAGLGTLGVGDAGDRERCLLGGGGAGDQRLGGGLGGVIEVEIGRRGPGLGGEAAMRVGTVLMATMMGMSIGGWMAGALFDLTGNYGSAFLTGLAWNVLNFAICAVLYMRHRRQHLVLAG